MDTWGPQAEYIRDGLDVEQWEQTVRKVSKTFNVPIRIMVTFGLLSIFNFKTFIKKVFELRADGIDIMFNCARLVDPKQFDLRILPDSANKYFEDTNTFISENHNLIKSVEHETWKMVYDFWQARYSTMNESEREWRKDQFKKFTTEYDKRRERDFYSVFPELASWI
jgi:hypothetical protein